MRLVHCAACNTPLCFLVGSLLTFRYRSILLLLGQVLLDDDRGSTFVHCCCAGLPPKEQETLHIWLNRMGSVCRLFIIHACIFLFHLAYCLGPFSNKDGEEDQKYNKN